MSSLTISSLGAITNYVISQETTPTDKALTSIGNALKSSDLDTAETDVTTLQKNFENGLLSTSVSASQASSQALSLLSRDAQFVLKAIKAGDAKTAQKALDTLRSDYKNYHTLTADLSSGGGGANSIASQIFNSMGTQSMTHPKSATDNINTLLQAYASYRYYQSANETIEHSVPPGTYYNERA